MAENYYLPPEEAGTLNRVLTIGSTRVSQDIQSHGELPRSDPRDMPSADFDARFDVDKGALQPPDAGGEIEAAAADEHIHPPTTEEEARAGCRDAWVDPAQLTKGPGRMPKAPKHGAFASVTNMTMPTSGTNNGARQTVRVRQLRAGKLLPEDIPLFFTDAVTAHQLSHQYDQFSWSSVLPHTATLPQRYLVPIVGVTCSNPEAVQNPQSYSLVTAPPPGISLDALLAKQMEAPYKPLYSDGDALRWALQVAKGLRYLHENRRRLVHGSLHPGTVWLAGSGPPSTWAALLNDYSQSTLLVHPAHDAAKGLALRVGTPRLLEASRNGSPALDRHGKPIEPRKLADTEVAMVYLAPEAFVPGAASGTAADIYALGWLLFELYAREQTFQAARFRDRVRDINAFIDLHTLRGARPHIPTPRIPPPIAALISACWAPDPRNRPDAAQVVETLQDHMLAVGVEEQARTSKGTSYQTSSGCGCVIS